MKQVFDSIQSALDALPDKAFTGQWDYSSWSKLEAYIRGRRRDAMAPVRAKQEVARLKGLRPRERPRETNPRVVSRQREDVATPRHPNQA